MTGDGSARDESASEPGAVVGQAISDIAAADETDGVAAVAARALGQLTGATVDCLVVDDDGNALAVAASDETNPSTRRDLNDYPSGLPEDLSWPADPATVSVGDAGVVVWADGGSPAPEWAMRSIASAAVDAARGRAQRAGDRRRIEELESQAEQLDDFATIVAHDLRNPLAIAQGHLELARDLGGEEHFEKIDDAHERIQRIIDHTLTMATEGGGDVQTERVKIATVAREAWETVETGDATLTVSDSMGLSADRERLQQLFENLFRNAVEHGTPVEHVYQSGEGDGVAETALAVEVGILPGEEGFFVADNGPGIPEAEREHVFDQGYSDNGGTGFGLSIIDDIVTEHGWSVAVTDGSAGGARFEFTDCTDPHSSAR